MARMNSKQNTNMVANSAPDGSAGPKGPRRACNPVIGAVGLSLLLSLSACAGEAGPGGTGTVSGAGTNAGMDGTGAVNPGSGDGSGADVGVGDGTNADMGGAGVGVNPGAGGGSGVAAGTGGGTIVGVGGGMNAGGSGDPAGPVIANKPIHRLNNLEYDNTLSHLLSTEVSVGESFGSEEAEGFDNVAEALSMSPRQVEDYFVAARTLSATVFADETLRARIVTCDPVADATCPETVITNFGKRAFRRPLEAIETQGFLAKYQEALTLGVDAMGALQHVVHTMLASPQFLYRIEFDPDVADTTPHEVSSWELASRLSYALWSSMPDDALFARAEAGDILQPDVLVAEVDRMLEDDRSRALVESFAGQWFGSRRLSKHVANVGIFPAWNAELASSMQQEMDLYFSEFLYGDLPYTDFLTTDMNFVDPALAELYGMAAPSGAGFEQVVDTSDQRMGFLGLAGFLTHTSSEKISSPIIRGKWILDSAWCLELKLPDGVVVEPLEEPEEGEPLIMTIREQMAAHRDDASCSGCHDIIDPIGLSLENFDGIGRYRDVYEGGLAIDTVGAMPGGETVDSLASLSAVVAQDPKFLSCAVHKFGTYAMGLAMASANRDQVVAAWTAGMPTLRNLLKETVRHEMFRMRRAEGL